MKHIFQKTFAGLSPQYYFRQLVFGGVIALLFYFSQTQGNKEISTALLLLMPVNTFLYPYSRFVYESIIGFIFGENVLSVNAILMLIVKLITMMLCWSFATMIAPIGLIYLYIYHSKK